EILRLFRFHDDIEEKITQTLAPFKDTIKLGVHIRRGDYARWQGGKYFYNDDQFMHVIAQFVSLYPDKTVEIFICGNDPKLNRDAYKHAFG
ncbi:glycosyltransferase, partial [Veillonellaceae bacterium M2-8]|nr:glycosyltransferase [Veillonellaceae bacterium M2-8]